MKKTLLSVLFVVLCAAPVWAGSGGDVNGDGEINIGDVNALIDMILSGTYNAAADTNGDGEINISDVNAVIDNILGGGQHTGTDPVSYTVDDVSFTMIHVDGGTFRMGATEEQLYPSNAEKPVHEVTLSSFFIGQTEVTNGLWKAVTGSYPRGYYYVNPTYAAEAVSWDECQEFITKLNQLTGKTFRMPTEAEWEYAARGGNKSKSYVYAGGNDIEDVAWYRTNGKHQCHTVATKAPNELGLYDMSGNESEWCSDWYGAYTGDAQTNPTGPATGTERVFRGGNHESDKDDCRLSHRRSFAPDYNGHWTGLRLVIVNP